MAIKCGGIQNFEPLPVPFVTLLLPRHFCYRQCCGAGPFLIGSDSRYFFFTGSGSFSYKNRLKSSKENVFAFTSSHWLRLRPKSTGSDLLRLRNTEYNNMIKCRTLYRVKNRMFWGGSVGVKDRGKRDRDQSLCFHPCLLIRL